MIVVEDILDSGNNPLSYLLQLLQARSPASRAAVHPAG